MAEPEPGSSPTLRPPPQQEQEVSYFFEMLKHPLNGWGLASGLVVGSIAAVATGITPVLLLPVIAQAGVNAILGLFLPESPVFRELVDGRVRQRRRESERAWLEQQISARIVGTHGNWNSYHRMREQQGALRRIAQDKRTSLGLRDVEKLDSGTVDFLRLWLARLVIRDRHRSLDEAQVRAHLGDVMRQLDDDSLSPAERGRLEKAREDLETVLERRRKLELHENSMAASMLSMADGFSEIHQRVIANPSGEDLSGWINDQVGRMSVVEELDFAAEIELDAAIGLSRAARGAAERAAAAETGPQPGAVVSRKSSKRKEKA
jgi:hypothetical protein